MPDPTLDAHIESLFDQALALAPGLRAAFLDRQCAAAPALRARLDRLLALAGRDDGFLDRQPTLQADPGTATRDAGLAAGQLLAAYRLLRPLGAGGMGEVWLAERVEGGFEQLVAIKCLRGDSPALSARFDAERAILAGLEHAGIARLYDGGIAADGRPYMVMEYVEGEDLLSWCRHRQADLATRLALFLQVCDAVAYAHAQLVVHRDLKPGNILVSADGRIKLLDFGIAKLLQDPGLGEATDTAHLSPAYAGPEQLTGGRIGTATDVHALGVILYQLLTGVLPWPVVGLPLGTAVQRLLTTSPRPPSQVATGQAPLPARLLRGDLDAIVGKALRPEPDQRYPDARALADDLRRHLRHQPVQARQGARLYVLRRFVRRHWLPLAAVGAVFAALVVGLVGIAWQAARAEIQAARATATKDYLVRVFQASDPNTASDQPRGQITARELLDLGAARIEADFADQRALQIELLGLTAGLYRALGERARYAELQRRHMALARQIHGELHPIVLQGLLLEADDAVLSHDYAEAELRLAQIDPLIRRAGLDDSALRARWWLRMGNAVEAEPARIDERIAALSRAVALFQRSDPGDREYGTALANLAAAHWERGAPDAMVQTRDGLLRSAAAMEQGRDRNDGELLVVYTNLALVQSSLGDSQGTDVAAARAVELARQTYGENNRRYWNAVAVRASALHERGERQRAWPLFDQVRALLPDEPALEDEDAVALVLTLLGAALVQDGQPQAALAVLERAERGHDRAERGHRWGYLRRSLGEAYEATGQHAQARRQFDLSVQAVLAETPAGGERVLAARERRARFRLGQGELAAAEEEFREILDLAPEQPLAVTAMARGGLARLALARREHEAALLASRQALALLAQVEAAPGLRMQPELWRIHAEALARSGAMAEARDYARRALDVYRRHQHPDSPAIAEVEAFLAQLRLSH